MTLDQQGYICVIGAVNVDIIASSYVRLIHKDSNPGSVNISYGGVGRNIAENLCRLNQRVELITVLGDDVHADEISGQCSDLGISLEHSLKVKDEYSSMYICINDEKGEMQMAVSVMEICDRYHCVWDVTLKDLETTSGDSQAIVLWTGIIREELEKHYG